MDGADAFLTTPKNFGLKYIFGTPGTTEAPLLDRLAVDGNLRYILALHESVAVAMADGLAKAGGGPGVVSVHTTVGTANSMGMLINAFADRVPVILAAGLKDPPGTGHGRFLRCAHPGDGLDQTVHQVVLAGLNGGPPRTGDGQSPALDLEPATGAGIPGHSGGLLGPPGQGGRSCQGIDRSRGPG